MLNMHFIENDNNIKFCFYFMVNLILIRNKNVLELIKTILELIFGLIG